MRVKRATFSKIAGLVCLSFFIGCGDGKKSVELTGSGSDSESITAFSNQLKAEDQSFVYRQVTECVSQISKLYHATPMGMTHSFNRIQFEMDGEVFYIVPNGTEVFFLSDSFIFRSDLGKIESEHISQKATEFVKNGEVYHQHVRYMSIQYYSKSKSQKVSVKVAPLKQMIYRDPITNRIQFTGYYRGHLGQDNFNSYAQNYDLNLFHEDSIGKIDAVTDGKAAYWNVIEEIVSGAIDQIKADTFEKSAAVVKESFAKLGENLNACRNSGLEKINQAAERLALRIEAQKEES